MQKKSLRLTRANAGLVVVDIQERLVPAIFEQQRVVQNSVRLIQGAGILQVPIFATEQYRKGLGPTVAEVAITNVCNKLTIAEVNGSLWVHENADAPAP